jgi:C4-dicarboxylate-specific signal transduction histidine kinase
MSEREKNLEERLVELEEAYEELKKTKEVLSARTVVAWIGMVSATWAHAVRREVGTIRGLLMLLRNAVETAAPPDKISALIEQLDATATRIAEVPLTAPLSTEGGVESIDINAFLQQSVSGPLQRYKDVNFVGEFARDDQDITVRANPEWLRRAVQIIVENALEAMMNSSQKILTISTRADAGAVEIRFTDTGPGIPQTVLPHLFLEPIKKARGEKGTGIGLLLANTIAQAYGGEIKVTDTGPEGSTLVLTLPRKE